jgi:hypothetical protein
MKARKNPTFKQMMRRFRRPPKRDDPRFKFDSYWALREQGYSHAYAKRAHRDKPPTVTYIKSETDYACDPEDLLVDGPKDPSCPAGHFKQVETDIRPLLTPEVVPTLEPRESEYTVWDSKLPGFGLRVRPSGHKSFIVLCRVRGQKRLKKITIGRAHWIDFDIAREVAQDLLAAAKMGREPTGDFRGLGAYRYESCIPKKAPLEERPTLILTDRNEDEDEEDDEADFPFE